MSISGETCQITLIIPAQLLCLSLDQLIVPDTLGKSWMMIVFFITLPDKDLQILILLILFILPQETIGLKVLGLVAPFIVDVIDQEDQKEGDECPAEDEMDQAEKRHG